MAKPLTTASVEKMKPDPDKRREVPDGLLPGLYLLIQPSGRKSWAVRYRLDGKPAKHTLGSYAAVELAEAREAAREVLQGVAKGKGPAQARADREAARPKTFAVIAAAYIERYAKPRKRTWAEDEATIKRDLLPAWGSRTAAGITRRDVLALLEGKAKAAPVRANRVLALARKLFGWAVDVDLLPASPAAAIKAPSAEHQRDRVLSDDELAAFWCATGRMAWPWGGYFRVLALTAQRRGEVAGMRREQLDRKARLWTLPADAVKGARVHEVPLTAAVEAILDDVPIFKGPCVFTARGGERPVAGFGAAKVQLDELMRIELGKLAPWRLHDLRRTAASGMARMGFPPHVVSAVLNHSPGSTQGITAIYNRYRYGDEKRRALEAWASHMIGLVEEPQTNVVVLRA